jgi:hypothetical protein
MQPTCQWLVGSNLGLEQWADLSGVFSVYQPICPNLPTPYLRIFDYEDQFRDRQLTWVLWLIGLGFVAVILTIIGLILRWVFRKLRRRKQARQQNKIEVDQIPVP